MDGLRIVPADDHPVLREGLRLLVEAQPDMEVVAQAGGGREAVQLAAQLGLSVKTVESYKAGALEKLQLRSRTDIIRHALACNWLSDELGPEQGRSGAGIGPG